MKYHKEGPACGRIPYDATSSEADCEYPFDQNQAVKQLPGYAGNRDLVFA